jgi:hypothetical protein
MVGTLIVAAAAGTTAAGVAASFALTATAFAVNFAVSMIVTRMFADNPETQQDMGVRQQVPPSQVNAVPIVYGDAYMGGTFVDAVLTTDQKTMYYVLAISSISQSNATLGTAAGVFNYDTTKMYYGDRLITFDGTDLTKVVSLTDEAGNVDTKISGNLYINLYKSSNAGVITSVNGASAPSTVMGGSDIAVGQRWPATNRQMNNLAFAIVKLVYNRDADTTGLNPITFRVSHYPNGASVAKPGDVWLDYITNQEYGGAVGWMPNGTFSAAFVDTACVAPLNSYSDATITYTPAGGGSPVTQSRYRINGVLDAGQSVLSNIDRIMSSCDSWMTYNAALGQWSVVINKAETAAYAFTDNNIIGEIRVSASDITSSINQVEARFPFKENRDQASFVNLETPFGLLYPNEPVNKYSITYDLVNDSVQAQYLANRLLEQAREDLIVSFSTTYYGIQVDAGNVISVTNSDYGWSNKLFRVMKVNEASLPDGSLGAKLELSEYSAAVYDDQDVTQYAPVANSNLASPAYFSALSAPTVSATYPSASIPSFDVTITIPTIGRVTFGTLYYTTTPATPTSYLVLDIANSANNIPVVNGTTYTFANITLPAGTYYFAFTVGNETATSTKSANSSAFVWNPVGMVGPTGDSGLSAITAYRSQSQTSAAPATPSNTIGATAPAGWSLTAPSVTVGNVLWYSFGQYNSSGSTISGIPAGQTQWGVPTAASVFQDIKSDNWNGSNPPNFANPATYGTAGYYIQQSTGDVFFNNGLFRGNILSQGQFKLSGLGYTYGGSLSQNTVAYIDGSATIWGVYAKGADIFTTAVTGESYGGVGVQGSSTGGVGVGVGVYGFADTTGTALLAINNSASGYGFRLTGRMTIDNNLQVNNLNANYLQGNAASAFYMSGGALGTPSSGNFTSGSFTWPTFNQNTTGNAATATYATSAGSASTASYASNAGDSAGLGGVNSSGWARIFVGDAGTGNAAGAGMNFNCLISGYQFRGTSNFMYLEPVSDIRLKENIEPETLGLNFINALKPVTYHMIGKERKSHGFIAQDIENLITGEKDSLKIENADGMKGVDYMSLIAPLVKSIQELTAKVEILEKQLKG